ncbi:hypothetical protein N7456_003575 [Penicillium angulare]|uniref:Uncharacterized protein n=1 Tax=Penicillium angulare TaxID=116970 RepID=A0A9W9FUW8_9EURO|nr:hypothetical protein N7456_003575 [Penicillium angulare]
MYCRDTNQDIQEPSQAQGNDHHPKNGPPDPIAGDDVEHEPAYWGKFAERNPFRTSKSRSELMAAVLLNPVIREPVLKWNRSKIYTGDDFLRFITQRASNYEAFQIQARCRRLDGDDACSHCRDEYGVFASCIKFEGPNGERYCGNCRVGNREKRCDLWLPSVSTIAPSPAPAPGPTPTPAATPDPALPLAPPTSLDFHQTIIDCLLASLTREVNAIGQHLEILRDMNTTELGNLTSFDNTLDEILRRRDLIESMLDYNLSLEIDLKALQDICLPKTADNQDIPPDITYESMNALEPNLGNGQSIPGAFGGSMMWP